MPQNKLPRNLLPRNYFVLDSSNSQQVMWSCITLFILDWRSLYIKTFLTSFILNPFWELQHWLAMPETPWIHSLAYAKLTFDHWAFRNILLLPILSWPPTSSYTTPYGAVTYFHLRNKPHIIAKSENVIFP